jgi:chemotaxis protein histidine kinase CheA
MSCSSVPKSLLFALFGGAAIWLGGSWARPAAATELDPTPTKVEAPDTLAAPDEAAATSSVLATPIEEDGEAASHWDTGPTRDETPCDGGDGNQNEHLRITGAYDSDFEHGYGEAYTYDEQDGYGDESMDGQTGTEGAEEAAAVEDDQQEQKADSDADQDGYAEEFTYDEQDGYGEESMDSQTGVEQAGEVIIVEDLPEEQQADTYSDNDGYEHYGYGEEPMDGQTGAEQADEVIIVEDVPAERPADAPVYDKEDCYEDTDYTWDEEEAATAEEESAVGEDDFSYEFDDYKTHYGYETDELNAMEEEPAADVAEEPAADVAEEPAADAAEEPAADMAEEPAADAAEEPAADAAEEPAADAAEEPAADVTEEASADQEEEWEPYTYENAYDYADPTEHYGCDYDDGEIGGSSSEASGPAEAPRAAVDLFSRQPSELLEESDWALMRTLESLYREPSAARRARLNDYIESLGFEAIDFAYRFENSSDSDVLALADDLASVATLLACYRLVERDEACIDDAVGLLQRSLSSVTLDWIEAVGQGAASPAAESRADGSVHPVVGAMVAVTNRSIVAAKALAAGVAAELAEMPWTALTGRLDEVRSAAKPVSEGQSVAL